MGRPDTQKPPKLSLELPAFKARGPLQGDHTQCCRMRTGRSLTAHFASWGCLSGGVGRACSMQVAERRQVKRRWYVQVRHCLFGGSYWLMKVAKAGRMEHELTKSTKSAADSWPCWTWCFCGVCMKGNPGSREELGRQIHREVASTRLMLPRLKRRW